MGGGVVPTDCVPLHPVGGREGGARGRGFDCVVSKCLWLPTKFSKLGDSGFNWDAILCVYVFQVPPVQQKGSIGGLPGFPRPIVQPLTSIPPGGPPFIPTGFNPTNMPPGKTVGMM